MIETQKKNNQPEVDCFSSGGQRPQKKNKSLLDNIILLPNEIQNLIFYYCNTNPVCDTIRDSIFYNNNCVYENTITPSPLKNGKFISNMYNTELDILGFKFFKKKGVITKRKLKECCTYNNIFYNTTTRYTNKQLIQLLINI